MKKTVGFVDHFWLLLLLSHCQKEPGPENTSASRAPASGVEPARAPSPAAAPSSASASSRGSDAVDSDAGMGQWAESSAYKFKLTKIERCADPEPSRGTSIDAGSGEQLIRVGVSVQIFAKYDELFAAPRDVTLEKGGVIIQSVVNPKPSAGCSPLLEPKTLRHDQVAGGFVVFEVPDESYLRAGIVAFQPTRWGGAPRVEVKLQNSMTKLK